MTILLAGCQRSNILFYIYNYVCDKTHIIIKSSIKMYINDKTYQKK